MNDEDLMKAEEREERIRDAAPDMLKALKLWHGINDLQRKLIEAEIELAVLTSALIRKVEGTKPRGRNRNGRGHSHERST